MSHEGIQPEARPEETAIQGPVLEVPMVLGHAIDVTPIPHASDAFLGDSSRNLSRAPLSGFSGKAVALGLGVLGTIGVGGFGSASAQDTTEPPSSEGPRSTSTPEFGTPEPGESVAPTEDPITGVIPTCPPETSPSPTPLVEPTPPIIAVVNGKEFTLVDNTVTVRVLAQDAPASPLASEGPGIDTDGDGDIDEDDGETAAVNPNCLPIEKPRYDVSLSGVDLLNSIIADNQDKKDIEKTSISDIENKIDDMWGKYKDAFSNVRGIDDATVDKQYFKWWLKAMETGHHPNDTKKVIKSYTEQNIIDNRIRYSASSIIETLIVYQNTSDPDARFAIAELLDLERNYAVRGVNPAEWEKANRSFTNTVNNLIIVNKAQLPSSN